MKQNSVWWSLKYVEYFPIVFFIVVSFAPQQTSNWNLSDNISFLHYHANVTLRKHVWVEQRNSKVLTFYETTFKFTSFILFTCCLWLCRLRQKSEILEYHVLLSLNLCRLTEGRPLLLDNKRQIITKKAVICCSYTDIYFRHGLWIQ